MSDGNGIEAALAALLILSLLGTLVTATCAQSQKARFFKSLLLCVATIALSTLAIVARH